ncbi:neoverrucotoxin subunit alpha-like [Hemitrygon akajei]|uniref:neoverrucotoxin subunit alpha-like n=1 Tax=Hemitrygon akajei TaxID=2704970 RepID=UPI003BF955F3
MSEVMQLATVGRPFQLGMLYDCRSDTLIPGITLWDLQTLQSNVSSRDQPSTEFHIIASDSMDEKCSALNVSGSMKASLLCGLVEVKGSAKYLSDTKESKQQTRVTLQYKTTTRFEQLTMSHLGRQNITYPSVFDEGSATHVITAVLYGAQAFFVFDQMVSSAEKLQDIQGNMEMTIKRLPKISIEGEGSLKMTEEQKSNVEKFNCTFYGDFSLKSNPTTFQDAVSTYARLPSLLGPRGEHAVPMTVWLYPLSKLDSKAAQLVREVNVGLISHCQRVLEQLGEAVMRCNNMEKDRAAIQFPEVRDRIVKFRELCQEYKLVFQQNLARDLPIIRGGRGEEELLVDILKNKEDSPFRHQSLITWLDDKEREMKLVGHYLRIFNDVPSVKIVSELEDELMDHAMDYVVCFTFTTLHQEDVYLSETINYLQSHTAPKIQAPTPADGDSATQHGEQWFHSEIVKRKMKEQSQLFLEFAKANKSDRNIKFLVASVKDDNQIGTSIYLYEDACIKNRCFEPPSQPQRPVVGGTTHDSVTLQLYPPRYGMGEIVGYKIEYKGTQQEEWTTLDTQGKSESFTISGLQPHQEYNFQYQAVTKVGASKASDSSTQFTLPTSSPGKLIFQDCSPIATLSWDRPSHIGAGVEIVQYRIEYREETSVTSNTESRLWTEVKTTDNECWYNLMGLKPQTDYRVRVSADCGEAGSSVPSEEVLIKIGEVTKGIHQKHPTEGRLISPGNPSIYMLNLQKEVTVVAESPVPAAVMSEVIQLVTVGRPFQLGMLYDCRSDTLIPGITLWDLQTLQSNVSSRDQPSTEFHIIASDSMEEKVSALNVSGSMKASLLCGLVEVKESAKYLSDTKGSKQQAQVTLQYKTTTRFEQLTMSHLGRQNITYPKT